MASTRAFLIRALFAAAGETTIPVPPVKGTTYRDEAILPADFTDGWSFATTVDGATFNQILYEYSQVLDELDKYGVSGYSDLIDYPVNAVTRGSDGTLYFCTAPNGPATALKDPITPANRPDFWLSLAEKLSGSFLEASVNATLTAGFYITPTAPAIAAGSLMPVFVDRNQINFTVDQDFTLENPVTVPPGGSAKIYATQDGTGGWNLDLGTSYQQTADSGEWSIEAGAVNILWLDFGPGGIIDVTITQRGTA